MTGLCTTNGFMLGLKGVLDYNYVIEASANLFNWVSLVTNTSPFQFTDTNFDTFLFPLRAIWHGQVALPPNHFTFNSRWMPNFSLRLRLDTVLASAAASLAMA